MSRSRPANALLEKNLTDNTSDNFMFATGIECSNPVVTIDNRRIRRDQLDECGHYDNLYTDLQLIADVGIKYLRYGLPIHKIFISPEKFDWSFPDEAMAEIKRLGITPIIDLLHFGVPDWLGDFQNPELPHYFAEYAGEVARRYPEITHFTPVNEPYITARLSGIEGVWNEQLKSDTAFVTALKHAIACNVMAANRIADTRLQQGLPEPIIIPTESAEYKYEGRWTPSEETRQFNQIRLLSLNLLYRRPLGAEMKKYVSENGMTCDQYNWFMKGRRAGQEILGIDYYGWNERIISPTGREIKVEDVLGLSNICEEYYKLYKRPIMITETDWWNAEQSPAWLWKQWFNVMHMRDRGIPIVGMTWYSAGDQNDFDTALTEMNKRVSKCGLFGMDRQLHPVADELHVLLEQYGRTPLLPKWKMFARHGGMGETIAPAQILDFPRNDTQTHAKPVAA